MTIGSLAAKSARLVMPYSIVSDSVSAGVPEGFTMIKGMVHSNDTSVVREGIVANYDITHKTNVEEGSFKLLIPDTDSIVFFYSLNFGEIVIAPYDFISGHEVTIHFNVFSRESIYFPAMDKPVIYCYSEEPLTATIDLSIHGDVTFSYPAYNEGWTVDVNESGQLSTEDGKTYPYLFWEGISENLDFKVNQNGSYDGFYLKTDSVVNFLETQLASMGLNRAEQTDFITYWAPRIIENDFAFIQFMVDDDYAKNVANINVTPQPDHMKRVYILYAPLAELPKFTIKPQRFESLIRSGFTVIEWGGSELNLDPIQL
jgi:hypothetical protein